MAKASRKTAKKRVERREDVSQIPVVIFCGGKGTRLKEETEVIPKPLVRIGERPILWHIMKIYYEQGFRKFVLLLGYKGEKIKEYFYNYPLYSTNFTYHHIGDATKITFHHPIEEQWEVTCIDTGLETQTAGRLKRIQDHITAPYFMLTYGDGVANVDLHELLAYHREKGKLATMTAVHPPVRFGEVMLKDGEVTGFSEKPVQSESTAGETLINGGFFAVDSRIFRHIRKDDSLVFEKDILTKLAAKRQLAAMPHRKYWQCMDTIRDTETLNELWSSGKAPWKIW